VIAFLEALRPKQWIKNGLVLIGVVFAGMLADQAALARAALGFAGFSLLSGAVYLFNDLRDVEADRLHPKKRLRPIPSGRLPLGAAWAWLAVVLLGAGAIAWTLGPWYAATAGAYLVLNLAYSLGLKHVVLVDVLTIATGFVLRAIAGVELLRPLRPDVELSPWLLVCTFFLALFMACGKRRQEIRHQDSEQAEGRRRVLLAYTTPFPRHAGHRVRRDHARRLRDLHDLAGDGGEVPHHGPSVDGPVRDLRHLPLPVAHAGGGGGRGSLDHRARRPPAARLRRALARDRRRRPLPALMRRRAYAKINLMLAVGPKRADGYHEIATILCAISLHDTLSFRLRRRGFA
jgi:4-hydroxybenzoate polyprenyltransferase